ncbi:MAG: hypothetical protein ACKVU0_03555, partial [Saprospiraceae bacterium]
VDGIAVFNLEDEHGFLLLFVGEKIRMLKLGCKGKSSSAKITASSNIFSVITENQFFQKEKCPLIPQFDGGNAFLCLGNFIALPIINKSYLKPYAQPTQCSSQSDATSLYAQSRRVSRTRRIAKSIQRRHLESL